MMAAELSKALGWLTDGDIEQIEKLFVRAGLPVFGPNIGVDRYVPVDAS